MIFSDGFESGDTSAWDDVVGIGAGSDGSDDFRRKTAEAG
jgi:hypothetical protein